MSGLFANTGNYVTLRFSSRVQSVLLKSFAENPARLGLTGQRRQLPGSVLFCSVQRALMSFGAMPEGALEKALADADVDEEEQTGSRLSTTTSTVRACTFKLAAG